MKWSRNLDCQIWNLLGTGGTIQRNGIKYFLQYFLSIHLPLFSRDISSISNQYRPMKFLICENIGIKRNYEYFYIKVSNQLCSLQLQLDNFGLLALSFWNYLLFFSTGMLHRTQIMWVGNDVRKLRVLYCAHRNISCFDIYCLFVSHTKEYCHSPLRNKKSHILIPSPR